jgi:hypothetical protein
MKEPIMADEKEYSQVTRREAIHQFREAKVARFQELVKKDRYLAAQTILDPLGTLSRFGLIEDADRELNVEVTKGSLADIAYLKEAVASRGLENVLATEPPKEEVALLEAVGIGIVIRWDHVIIIVVIIVVY